MEDNSKPQKKFLNFHGRNYIAMKEFESKSCQGCCLVNKGCYKSEQALKICRTGYVFRPISEIEDINPLDF